MSDYGWIAFGILGWVLLGLYFVKNPLFRKSLPLPDAGAYAIAVSCGFVGSQEQWLESLLKPKVGITEWFSHYKDYFHDRKPGLVFYPGTYQHKEVLRLPLKNPYQPHSEEWYEQEYVWCYTEDEYHENHYAVTPSYMDWHREYMKTSAVSRKRDLRDKMLKEIRPRVQAKIRVQNRRPARSNY